MNMTPKDWIGAALLAASVTVLLLAMAFPGALSGAGSWAELTYLLLLLAFVGGSVVLRWDTPLRPALRYAAIWVAIVLTLCAGYLAWERFGEP